MQPFQARWTVLFCSRVMAISRTCSSLLPTPLTNGLSSLGTVQTPALCLKAKHHQDVSSLLMISGTTFQNKRRMKHFSREQSAVNGLLNQTPSKRNLKWNNASTFCRADANLALNARKIIRLNNNPQHWSCQRVKKSRTT